MTLTIPATRTISSTKGPQTLQEKYPNRLLPSIILAGFPKTGTTSVAYFLKSHPQVIFPGKKELNFLGMNSMSETEYVQKFPDCDIVNCTDKITFDGSIALSVTPRGFGDCLRNFPDAKLVFVVRNPVEKVYSYFRMDYRNGKSNSAELDYFDEIINNTLPQMEQFFADFEDHRQKTNPPYTFWQYIQKVRYEIDGEFMKFIPGSLYYYLMEPFLRSYPRDRIHVVNNYLLETEPEKEIIKLLKFAGLEIDPELDWEALKQNRHPPEEDMNPSTREKLSKFFMRYNQMLEDKMGESFDLDKS